MPHEAISVFDMFKIGVGAFKFAHTWSVESSFAVFGFYKKVWRN